MYKIRLTTHQFLRTRDVPTCVERVNRENVSSSENASAVQTWCKTFGRKVKAKERRFVSKRRKNRSFRVSQLRSVHKRTIGRRESCRIDDDR